MLKHCLKRTLSLLTGTFFSILSVTSHAQVNPSIGSGPWKYANPTQLGFTSLDMSFIDNNNGLAVGTNGGIAKTTDGGRNWQFIPFKYITTSGTYSLAQFNDVHFATPSIAYAVGIGGLMIKSTDGGINWSPIVTPLTAKGKNIDAVYFLNKDTGYIGGAAINTTNTTSIDDAPKVYFTKNGGSTWDSLATPFVRQETNASLNWNNQKEIFRIHFVNDSVGYACGSAGSGTSSLLWKIEKGVITDYSIHRSKFGMTSGTYSPATQTYRGLIGINDSLVLMSGTNGMIMRVNTGKNDSTANAVPAVFGNYVKGVYTLVAQANTNPPFPTNSPLNPGNMYHLKKLSGGRIAMPNGNQVAFSSDNGTSWTVTQPKPTTVNYTHWQFSALDVTPNGRIIVGGINGMIYDSLPGAASWQTSYNNVRPFFFALCSMDWADPCNGVVTGSRGAILKTTDGGKTWVNNTNPVFDAAQIGITNVFYPAVNNMFFTIPGSFGPPRIPPTVYRSDDQGTTNTAIFADPNPNNSLGFNTEQMAMVGPDIAFVASFRGSPEVERAVIFRTLNASAATPVWDTIKAFPWGTLAPSFKNIKFANKDTGYVAASRGKVYRTVNGGASWADVSPDTTVNGNGTATYSALSVVNGKTIFIGGSSRKLFKSTDAGATWTDMTMAAPAPPIPSFSSITTMVMNDASNGYMYAGSLLLKTADGWATWTYDMPPVAYASMVLYPKMAAPISSKKLYGMPINVAGFPDPDIISTGTAAFMEYGSSSVIANVSSSETATNASCTNPTAGSITVNATGGIPPLSFSINGGSYQSSNIFNGLTQGTKTITIKDAGCQTLTRTVSIGQTNDVVLTTNNDTTVCAGAPVPMLAKTNGTGTTYAWSPASGLSAANIGNPVATVSAASAFTVTATLNGCVKTKTVNIGMRPNPVVNAGPDKTIIIGDPVKLEGSSTTTPQSIVWTPAASLANANTFSPIATPQATITYTMTVKDINNCTSTDDAVVTVLPYCVRVKDAFTPNGDGLNDKWFVTAESGCTTRIYVTVFNRYGSIVYKNDNYNNNWDGTYEGKPLADGTYYYTVTYNLINGKTVQLKGNVTILR